MADEIAESIIQEIRTDAAIDAAHVVADGATDATHEVAAEIAQVGDELDEHAELSEERHEEILGDTAWLKNQLVLLLTNSQTLLSTITAFQTAMLTELTAMKTNLESMDTKPSSPETSEAEIIAVVEPPAVVVEDPQVPATPEPPKRRRRAI